MNDIAKTIAELKELESSATQGPWITNSIMGPICTEEGRHIANTHTCISINDAALIVAMRNALPELLAYIAELERDLAGSVEETRANFSALYHVANETLPDLEKQRNASLARAVKAEAAQFNSDTAYEFSLNELEQVKAERDALLTRFDTAAWKTNCDDCAFVEEGQKYCGFKNCSEAAAEWASQEAAKREGGTA